MFWMVVMPQRTHSSASARRLAAPSSTVAIDAKQRCGDHWAYSLTRPERRCDPGSRS
ncbi:hypothetical protein D3C85_1552120 [compost metagenome]